MLTGDVKKLCIQVLQDIVTRHQENRKKITDEILNQYMSIRQI